MRWSKRRNLTDTHCPIPALMMGVVVVVGMVVVVDLDAVVAVVVVR